MNVDISLRVLRRKRILVGLPNIALKGKSIRPSFTGKCQAPIHKAVKRKGIKILPE